MEKFLTGLGVEQQSQRHREAIFEKECRPDVDEYTFSKGFFNLDQSEVFSMGNLVGDTVVNFLELV